MLISSCVAAFSSISKSTTLVLTLYLSFVLINSHNEIDCSVDRAIVFKSTLYHNSNWFLLDHSSKSLFLPKLKRQLVPASCQNSLTSVPCDRPKVNKIFFCYRSRTKEKDMFIKLYYFYFNCCIFSGYHYMFAQKACLWTCAKPVDRLFLLQRHPLEPRKTF